MAKLSESDQKVLSASVWKSFSGSINAVSNEIPVKYHLEGNFSDHAGNILSVKVIIVRPNTNDPHEIVYRNLEINGQRIDENKYTVPSAITNELSNIVEKQKLSLLVGTQSINVNI